MEPMTIGSPTGSPSGPPSNYLPSYLMGESNITTAPRNNTLSPTKGRALAFVSSPTSPTSPTGDFNRSMLQQRALFGGQYQQGTPNAGYANTSQVNHNISISGPPTQSLFDSLRNEKNSVVDNSPFNQKQLINRQLNQSVAMNQSICDSYLNQSNLNSSRMPSNEQSSFDYRLSTPNFQSPPQPTSRPTNYWVTVYGFSPAATSMILSHFSQCGTIVEKVFPPQSGNWVHLRYSSSLECEKALNYHERILANSIMIGVTYCKDPSIIDKENAERLNLSVSRIRPLTQTAYKAAQSATDVTGTPTTPVRSSGIVNKAIDLFFGW